MIGWYMINFKLDYSVHSVKVWLYQLQSKNIASLPVFEFIFSKHIIIKPLTDSLIPLCSWYKECILLTQSQVIICSCQNESKQMAEIFHRMRSAGKTNVAFWQDFVWNQNSFWTSPLCLTQRILFVWVSCFLSYLDQLYSTCQLKSQDQEMRFLTSHEWIAKEGRFRLLQGLEIEGVWNWCLLQWNETRQ